MRSTDSLHRVLSAGCVGLLATLTAPFFLIDNTSIGFWLMQIVPLLITLPGVFRRNPRALQWLGFLVLFYFLNAVLQVSSSLAPQRALGLVTLLLCLILFTAVIVAIRRGKRPDSPRE
ncbi:MAG: hypothetical protein RLZZ227_1891 [Pseudomonadota bacterium]|jgi:uncharacterized membrane protein